MPRLTRRGLLKTAGAGLIAAPFLSLLDGKPARAAGRIKRVLFFCTMGTQPEIWTPTGISGDSITTFSSSTQPLAAIRDNIVLVEGLSSGTPTEGHGCPQALCGQGSQYEQSTTSVDQFIADKLKGMGVSTPIPALLVGDVTGEANTGKVMFRRNGTLVYPLASPRTVFNTVFGNFVPMNGTGVDTLNKRRLATCSLIEDDIGELQARLGPRERNRLQRHYDSIRQIQTRLMQMPTMPMGSCAVPAMPTDSSNALTNNRMHLDLIVNAFACDITRVGGIHYGNDQSLKVELPSVPLSGNEHGDFIHAGATEGFARLAKFEAWLAGEFAYVVQQLKMRDEADGSGKLLDNTLVIWCRDFGEANEHTMNSMRFVLAGGANKYLKTSAMGRYVKGAATKTTAVATNAPDRHERILLNVCDALGISDYAGFGDPGLTTYKKPYENIAL
jgi:Protein of unknown function (DUF1552)